MGQTAAFVQTVLEAIPEATMLIGLDYGILYANRAAREMAGESDPSLGGLKCHQVSHHREVPCDEAGELCPSLIPTRPS